ncbi:MAG: hypothetical protein ACKOQM_04985 [Novosphingobium sp.]
MDQTIAQIAPAGSVENVLRDELAHGDALIATIAPILRHLLANDEHSVFSDEIIARVRGMMTDIARQLLVDYETAAESADPRDIAPERITVMVEGLIGHAGFLAHIHALALEWQLTERMQTRLALDPELSPLLQALISSSEPQVSSSAMALLAAQARFATSQRRMQLPHAELPGDLLHAALLVLRNVSADQEVASRVEQAARGRFDESRSRLGLISRLVIGMGGGATAALSVTHAGVGIFLSALALASGQDRAMAVLATNEGQLARLAVALRASGLKTQTIEEQFDSLHPEVALPAGFETLGSDSAAALLARAASFPGG